MKSVYVFLLGMAEFRSDFTTHLDDWNLMIAYDQGRDLAHWLTFRYFERG